MSRVGPYCGQVEDAVFEYTAGVKLHVRVRRVTLVVAALQLVSAAAPAADERFRLANGLQVILQPDASRPRVAASVAYRVGQRDDPDGFGGLTHFVEHLMFEGSRRVEPGGHMAALEQVGATQVRGTTGLDRTTFSSEVPARAWRLPLWLESERMAFLLSRIDEASVEKQRSVLLNEAYQRGEHLAWGSRWVTASQALFPEGHPYHLDRGNALTDIQLEDVQVFFQKYFGPNRATVALVGKFEPSQARETIERYFGGIQNSFAAPSRAPIAYTPLAQEKLVKRHAAVYSESVVVAWPVPARFTKAGPRFKVLAEYLRQLPALHHALWDAEAGDIMIAFDANEHASVFWIEASMREDGHMDEVPSVIRDQFDRLVQEGANRTDIELARQRVVASWASLSDDFSARADFLSKYGRNIESEGVRHARVQPDQVAHALAWLASARPMVMTTQFDRRVLWGAYTE